MPETDKLQRELSKLERPELIDLAAKLTGFDFKRPKFGTAANVSGVRTSTQIFSQRRDCRTMFASDTRYGHHRRLGAWTGADKAAVSACRRVLRTARVPAAEISKIEVVSEWGASAERASENDRGPGEPHLLRKLAQARRAVDGVPVWSSYASVGLTAEGRIGWLELHWPELPSAVVKEAGLLRAIVERGFKPPGVSGARPESLEAGVIHSPGIGFYMDITPAIRAIYVADEPLIGRKVTLYLNRHGGLIDRPRDIKPAQPVQEKRPAKANRTG